MSQDVTDISSQLVASEQRISSIKAEIDKFEQIFIRTSSGYGSNKHMNDEYHNLILSTRDLSSHLATIQKAIENGAHDPHLRVRAHSLNTQAITQLRRLQNLGTQVQQFARSADRGLSQRGNKYASPLVDFTAQEKPSDVFSQQQQQKQLQFGPVQSDMDEQKAHDMEQLESDIVQVNELFTTLATYVHDQGTLVDSIGDNIEVAYEKVEAGTRQLDSAVTHRKSVRRKKCICIMIALIILIILIVALALSLRN